MNGILHLTVSVAVLATLIFRLRALRADRSAVQIATVLYFFFVLEVWFISVPSIWSAVTSTTGVPNFAGLLSHGGVIVAVACQQVTLVHLMHDGAVANRLTKVRLSVLGAALVAMAVLFFMNPLPGDFPTGFAVEQGRSTPAYILVFMTAYLFGQLDVARLCARLVRHAPTIWYRRGLYLVLVSAVLMGIYIVGRIADVVAGFFGGTGAAWEPIVLVAVGIGSILQVVGWILPDGGRLLTVLWAPVARRRAFRELGLLHEELVRHAPDVVLELTGKTSLRTRLYRRVVEIRDAQWALRQWMHPEVAEQTRVLAAKSERKRAAAEVEARLLAQAIEAKEAGRAPSTWIENPREAAPADMAAELQHLRRVAAVYGSNALSRRAVAIGWSEGVKHADR